MRRAARHRNCFSLPKKAETETEREIKKEREELGFQMVSIDQEEVLLKSLAIIRPSLAPDPPLLIRVGGDMFMSSCNQTTGWRARAPGDSIGLIIISPHCHLKGEKICD